MIKPLPVNCGSWSCSGIMYYPQVNARSGNLYLDICPWVNKSMASLVMNIYISDAIQVSVSLPTVQQYILHFHSVTSEKRLNKLLVFSTQYILLVSTNVVCERLSAMQEQVGLPEFLVHFANNTNCRVVKNQEYPPPSHGNLTITWHFKF